MTAVEFDILLKERLAKIQSVLSQKATEYATSDDRLHNFKRAAAMTGETVAQVVVGMMIKHWVSVLDIVQADADSCGIRVAMLDEKFGDSINYMILLEAVLREKYYSKGV